ncbi:hypothetical protein AB0G85_36365 [Streptomyces sioyaensis]|uniref:hypothetical protein n=1 Tax=Streptomyces sioyaensis TaxID=67364 RepID=UPI0033ED17CE
MTSAVLWSAFSHLTTVAVDRVVVDDGAVTVMARAVASETACPGCGRSPDVCTAATGAAWQLWRWLAAQS